MTSGLYLTEKDTQKIALDYTYSMGQLEGMSSLISMIENIEDEIENES